MMSIGNGSLNDNDDFIRLPDVCIPTVSIIFYIYPPDEPLEHVVSVKLKCILCQTNDNTFKLNDDLRYYCLHS